MNVRRFFLGVVMVFFGLNNIRGEELSALFEVGQPSRQPFSTWAYGYGALSDDQTHVAVYIAGGDGQRIHIGSKAEVRLEGSQGNSSTVAGRVTDLLSEADPHTHQGIATIQIPPQSFPPRTYAHIQIEISSRFALAVPTTAVIWTNGKPTVYKQKEKNDFDPIEVEIGEQTPIFTEIKRGLNSNDKILIQGAAEWALKQSGGEAE